MKHQVQYKLDIISNVWNNYIWDYPSCQKLINFTKVSQSNYIGDIFGYFHDTFEIIFNKQSGTDYVQIFSSHISFLQAIYVQQDFIEEMLVIFKTSLTKEHLKKDFNYSINREIRNEIIGHPIRKFDGKLVSSSLFGYERSTDKIVYLQYHEKNNFEFELIEHNIGDIVSRHIEFLNTYFDKIIEKLSQILSHFKKEIIIVQNNLPKISFEKLIILLSQKFSYFLNNTYLYDKESITKIYAKRMTHKRYRIVLECFHKDLRSMLDEQLINCDSVFNMPNNSTHKSLDFEIPLFNDDGDFININVKKKVGRPKTNYNYELGKIATKRSPNEFEMYSRFLIGKCKNKTVLSELEYMKANIYDEIEYLSSFYHIRKILKN